MSPLVFCAFQYFEDNKLNPKDVIPGLWRMAVVFALAMLAFLATNGFWPALPLAVRFLTAALFGVLQVRFMIFYDTWYMIPDIRYR